MGLSLSPADVDDILILERVTSIFSVIGCIFIFITFLFSKKFRRPVNRLIFYASWGNLLMNVATLLSVTPTQALRPKESPLCRFQGFLIQIFLPADAFWNLSMAINVYLTVFRKWSAKSLRRLEPFYLAFNYGLTFAIALVYLFINELEGEQRGRMYGPATLWCWVDGAWEGFRIWLVYIPAWVAILAIFIIYSMSWMHIRRSRRALETESFNDSSPTETSGDAKLKATEIRVTTELTRHSFVSPIVSPHMPVDEPPRIDSDGTSASETYVFNPFRLDPTCNRGFDPYTVTIERHEDAVAARRRAVATAANAEAWAYTQTALLYFISLLITWVPSSMNRVYSLVHVSDVSFAFSIMAGLVLPLMGFWNAVIYIVTSWDAVKAMFDDIAHGRAGEFGLPRRKRRSGDERRCRGWFEIEGIKTPEPGTRMNRACSQSSQTETEDGGADEQQRRERASVDTARVGGSWPHPSKQEIEMSTNMKTRTNAERR